MQTKEAKYEYVKLEYKQGYRKAMMFLKYSSWPVIKQKNTKEYHKEK